PHTTTPPPPDPPPLSLPDALPILFVTTPPTPSHACTLQSPAVWLGSGVPAAVAVNPHAPAMHERTLQNVSAPGHCEAVVHPRQADRKSTRLNSSHQIISYAVFCLK